MKRLRSELTEAGYKVIVTTSTHILYEPDEPFADGGDSDEISSLIQGYGYAVTGRLDEPKAGKEQKIASLDEDRLNYLADFCDVMLIEADGARRKHIKAPAEWEPVIIPRTDMVISVIGADTLGRKIEEAAYRPEEFAAFLGKSASDVIESEDIIKTVTSDAGLRKGVGDRDYGFYLNAVDECTASPAEIEDLMKRLNSEYGVNASCGSLANIGEMGAVILGAGLSERFGGNKLEMEISGKPIYMHVLDEIGAVLGYDRITFVTSHSEAAEAASKAGASVVINDRPEDGISRSMHLGLAANMHMGSCLFAVADQPLISRESIRALTEGYMKSDKCLASLTDDKGELANPCIFSAPYYAELLEITGDRGGKSVLKKHADDIYTCAPASMSELEDIDTIEDYERIQNERIL